MQIDSMSIRTLGCHPEAARETGGPVTLCRVIGIVDGTHEDDGSLTGWFEGVNLQSGPLLGLRRSWALFLPNGIHQIVERAALEAKGAVVQFALEIRSVPAINMFGYSYEAIPLVKPTPAPGLRELREVAGIAVSETGSCGAVVDEVVIEKDGDDASSTVPFAEPVKRRGGWPKGKKRGSASPRPRKGKGRPRKRHNGIM
jgi:hypothetical protein